MKEPALSSLVLIDASKSERESNALRLLFKVKCSRGTETPAMNFRCSAAATQATSSEDIGEVWDFFVFVCESLSVCFSLFPTSGRSCFFYK